MRCVHLVLHDEHESFVWTFLRRKFSCVKFHLLIDAYMYISNTLCIVLLSLVA